VNSYPQSSVSHFAHRYGVVADESKAIELFQKAADKGHVGAKEALSAPPRRDGDGQAGAKEALSTPTQRGGDEDTKPPAQPTEATGSTFEVPRIEVTRPSLTQEQLARKFKR
jgi:TPR repeat protein